MTPAAGPAPSVSDSLSALFEAQRQAFLRNPFPSPAERRRHLDSVISSLLDRQRDFAAAIDADFGGRSLREVQFSEVFVSLASLRYARRRLGSWMRPRPASVDPALQPARAFVLPQPAGVVGIISPWNYPLFLSLGPLAGALAAGNRVMIKPSEFTPATSALLAEVLGSLFRPDHVHVVNGGADRGVEFAALPWNHLLFTGSTAVGRQVMRAAAEHLTPVTLELGGKSPAILAPDADPRRAAASIIYGKLLNAGQTCVAPDYVLVPGAALREFAGAALAAAEHYYPAAASNADYTSILNLHHAGRLFDYIEEGRSAGVEMLPGPLPSSPTRRLPLILALNPPPSLRLMNEEIFGPVLPLVPYSSLEEALAFVNARPRPLALYLFSSDRSTIRRVQQGTVSGAFSLNETILHCAVESLPFGGAGPSGIGSYHGRAGFDAFSQLKPVFLRRWPAFSSALRPPYGALHAFAARLLLR